MILQIVLTIGLALMMVYAMIQRANVRVLASAIVIFGIAGLVFVWYPDLTSRVSQAVGVGRGVDLIFYLGALVGAAMLTIVHVRVKTQEQLITRLAREIALDRARAPDGANGRASVAENGFERDDPRPT